MAFGTPESLPYGLGLRSEGADLTALLPKFFCIRHGPADRPGLFLKRDCHEVGLGHSVRNLDPELCGRKVA